MDKLVQPREYPQNSPSSEYTQYVPTSENLISKTGIQIAKQVQKIIADMSVGRALQALATINLLQPSLLNGNTSEEHVIFDASTLALA